MIRVALPGFLWAGAAFALLPLALHFLTRRPPERQPLPTAGFLREDARTLVRLSRTPSDAGLLALRMAFALLLGAAFAGLSWHPAPSGEGHVILLDAGAGWNDVAGDGWTAARRAAEAAASTASAPGTASGDAGAEVVVVAYGLPEGLRSVTNGELGTLEAGPGAATFEDGLRALRTTSLTRGWAGARATWITRGTWEQWTPGLALMRPALWPGSIELLEWTRPEVPADDAAPSAPGPERRPIPLPDGPERTTLARALAAAGLDTAAVTDADVTEILPVGTGSVPTGPGYRLVAVHEDASPRASAELSEEGCRVHLAGRWASVIQEEGPRLPDFLRTLADGCLSLGTDLPIDAAARSVLAGTDLPTRTDLHAMDAPGTPLHRWILAVLVLLLVAELSLVGRAGTRPPLAADSRVTP